MPPRRTRLAGIPTVPPGIQDRDLRLVLERITESVRALQDGVVTNADMTDAISRLETRVITGDVVPGEPGGQGIPGPPGVSGSDGIPGLVRLSYNRRVNDEPDSQGEYSFPGVTSEDWADIRDAREVTLFDTDENGDSHSRYLSDVARDDIYVKIVSNLQWSAHIIESVRGFSFTAIGLPSGLRLEDRGDFLEVVGVAPSAGVYEFILRAISGGVAFDTPWRIIVAAA